MKTDSPHSPRITPNTIFPIWVVNQLSKNKDFEREFKDYALAYFDIKGTPNTWQTFSSIDSCLLSLRQIAYKYRLFGIIKFNKQDAEANFPNKTTIDGVIKCAQYTKADKYYFFSEKTKWTISDILLSYFCFRFNVKSVSYKNGERYLYNAMPGLLVKTPPPIIKKSTRNNILKTEPRPPQSWKNNPEQWSSIYKKADFHIFAEPGECNNCGEDFNARYGYKHDSKSIYFCTKCYKLIFPKIGLKRKVIYLPMGGQPKKH